MVQQWNNVITLDVFTVFHCLLFANRYGLFDCLCGEIAQNKTPKISQTMRKNSLTKTFYMLSGKPNQERKKKWKEKKLKSIRQLLLHSQTKQSNCFIFWSANSKYKKRNGKTKQNPRNLAHFNISLRVFSSFWPRQKQFIFIFDFVWICFQ